MRRGGDASPLRYPIGMPRAGPIRSAAFPHLRSYCGIVPSTDATAAAHSSTAFRVVARVGFAASGLVHLGIGILAIALAQGHAAEADQTGALQGIARLPGGVLLLWACAATLWALTLWYIVDGIWDRRRNGWSALVSAWSKAAAYLAVGALAAGVALGSASNSEQSAKSTGATLLSLPGGPWLLGALGAAITGVGIGFGWRGLTRGLRESIAFPRGPVGGAALALAVAGYVAKGAALISVGAIMAIAALTVDPAAAGGLDGAFVALLRLPLGAAIVTAIGIGLVAYGLVMFVRTRWAKL